MDKLCDILGHEWRGISDRFRRCALCDISPREEACDGMGHEWEVENVYPHTLYASCSFCDLSYGVEIGSLRVVMFYNSWDGRKTKEVPLSDVPDELKNKFASVMQSASYRR